MPPPPLLHGALLHAGARMLTLALGLALLVTVARLGPAVQGAFALFVAVESALLTLGSGLGILLAREVSHVTSAASPPRTRALLAAATVLGAGAAVCLLSWSALSDATPYRHLWLLALAAPVLLWVPTASGLWLGQGRLLALNAPAVAAPALVLALVLVAPGPAGAPAVLAVLVAWVAGKVLVALVTGVVALRGTASIPPTMPDPVARTSTWRFAATVGLANLISLLNLRATLFLVERSQGLAEAGVYSVAVQVAELLWLASSAFTVAAYHRIGGADVAAAARTTLVALRAGLGVALVAAPALAALAWWGLPWALGPAYDGARVPLLILLPGVALYAAASSLSAFHTNLHGRPMWAARVAGLSLVLTLLGAALWVPRWGGLGAALATSLAYTGAIVWAGRGFLRSQGWGWRVLWSGPPGAAAPQSAPA